jgi:hypothetical protein
MKRGRRRARAKTFYYMIQPYHPYPLHQPRYGILFIHYGLTMGSNSQLLRGCGKEMNVKISKCHICNNFFNSKKKLKDHIDKNHRINHMTATSTEAERIVDDILSSSNEILAISVMDRSGNILVAKSRESFKKRFDVSSLEENIHSGALAIATLSVVNQVKDVFEEPDAIITIHKGCKLMLLPMLSYDILIGLALERPDNTDDDKIANEIERLVADTLKPQ